MGFSCEVVDSRNFTEEKNASYGANKLEECCWGALHNGICCCWAYDDWVIPLPVIATMVEKRCCWEICKLDMVAIGIDLHRRLSLWLRMAGGPNYCWSKFLWEMSERVTSVVERVS